MRKIVYGWVAPDSNLEPMLIEMCGRIGGVIQGKKRKGLCRVAVRLILEGEHPQAEGRRATVRQQPQPVIALRKDIENVVRGLNGTEKIDDIVNRIMDRIAQRTGVR